MRAASVLVGGRRLPAAVEGERVLVGGGDCGVDGLIASGAALEPIAELALADVTFDAPLRPPVIFCVGRNYAEHAREAGGGDGFDFFLKAGQTIAAPSDPCALDAARTTMLDYETELGVVIGRTARRVTSRDAWHHVFGYVVVNDLSARDRQFPAPGRAALGPGKNFDGATRLAVTVVTSDEVGDPHALHIETRVNGEVRQSASTSQMLTSIHEIVARLSQLMTLRPGTVIATGTPAGTALGGSAYLSAGDVVVSAVEDVGELEFDVVEREDA